MRTKPVIKLVHNLLSNKHCCCMNVSSCCQWKSYQMLVAAENKMQKNTTHRFHSLCYKTWHSLVRIPRIYFLDIVLRVQNHKNSDQGRSDCTKQSFLASAKVTGLEIKGQTVDHGRLKELFWTIYFQLLVPRTPSTTPTRKLWQITWVENVPDSNWP